MKIRREQALNNGRVTLKKKKHMHICVYKSASFHQRAVNRTSESKDLPKIDKWKKKKEAEEQQNSGQSHNDSIYIVSISNIVTSIMTIKTAKQIKKKKKRRLLERSRHRLQPFQHRLCVVLQRLRRPFALCQQQRELRLEVVCLRGIHYGGLLGSG